MRYFQNLNGEVFGYDETQQGLIAQAVNLQWTEVTSTWPPAPPVVFKTQFTSLDYIEKFTVAEQLTVATATLANAEIKLWYDKMLAADFVDLNDPRTSAGLDALIAAGLLAPNRKAQILAPVEVLA